MKWEEFVKEGFVEKRGKSEQLAKSLLGKAVKRFNFFGAKETSEFTMEGIYEAIIELSHSLLALEGLKTLSHECAIEFLRGRYLDDSEIEKLDKLRKRRHGSKYYGESLNENTLKMNIENGEMLFLKLKRMIGKKHGLL